jgi:hypothetical protein
MCMTGLQAVCGVTISLLSKPRQQMQERARSPVSRTCLHLAWLAVGRGGALETV